MHVPDGILAPPVWMGLATASAFALGYVGRRLRQQAWQQNIPLMGVMGAFVFAAQMVNFPILPGTSSHLLGSALLTLTLGQPLASMAMTAVLTLQAFIFQDGGVLALGANVFNMAVMGTLVAQWAGRAFGLYKKTWGAVAAGWFSVTIAGALAVAELLASGIRLPSWSVWLALGALALTGIVEGLLTAAILALLERSGLRKLETPIGRQSRIVAVTALLSVVALTAGALIASADPDILETALVKTGLDKLATTLLQSPFGDYQAPIAGPSWLRQVLAGALGIALIVGAALLLARFYTSRKKLPPRCTTSS